MRRPPPPTPLTRAAFARLRAETTPDRTLFEVRAAINASGLDWEGDQLMIDLLFSNPEQAEELYEACYAPLLAVEAWDGEIVASLRIRTAGVETTMKRCLIRDIPSLS